MADERGRVRLGTVALVETLKQSHYQDIAAAVPDIAELLESPNPTIRGDAAYLLGIIGHKNALPFLVDPLNSKNENHLVRETIRESIERIEEHP